MGCLWLVRVDRILWVQWILRHLGLFGKERILRNFRIQWEERVFWTKRIQRILWLEWMVGMERAIRGFRAKRSFWSQRPERLVRMEWMVWIQR